MSQSDAYARDQAIALNTSFRTISKTMTWTAIFLDLVGLTLTAILLCLTFNIFRLPVYHPTQMRPWKDWTAYWRVFSPIPFLWVVPVALFMLPFYPSGIALIIFLVLCAPALIMTLISVFWMMIQDWKHCSETLWCACITDYQVVGGVVTMTYCGTGAGTGTGPFIADIFLKWGAIIMVVVAGIFSLLFHNSYADEGSVYEGSNTNRMLINEENMAGPSVPMLGGRKRV